MAGEGPHNQPDDSGEPTTVADAYSPPAPGQNAGRSKFLLIVSAVVALCIVVFMVAVLLR